MRFSAKDTQPVAWKNGGGRTRELARHQEGVPASGRSKGRMVWRISLADIDVSGPFSAFPGLARIHTVVAGAGHRLTGEGVTLVAQPLKPLVFDGALALDCQLIGGSCQAFNVIYDPELVQAKARVLRAGEWPVDGAADWAAGADCHVVFVAEGSLTLDGHGTLSNGEGRTLDSAVRGEISDDGAVILVRFALVRA